MRNFLFAGVAAVALVAVPVVAGAQDELKRPQRGGNEANTNQPGRSETAPGRNRPDANTNAPGRSESAPGQNRRDQANDDQGQAGQNRRQQADDQQGRDRNNRQQADDQQGRDRNNQQAGDRNNDRNDNNRQANDRDRDTVVRAVARLDQRERVRITATLRERAPRVDRVDFRVNIGVNLPTRIRLAPVPETVVSIVPEYRGYDYVLVEDRIVIVEPSSRRIVVVMDQDGKVDETRTTVRLNLGEDKIKIIRRDIGDRNKVTRNITIREGVEVPADVELAPLPEVVVREVPEVMNYRYFVHNDEIVLVAPDSRRVVEVID